MLSMGGQKILCMCVVCGAVPKHNCNRVMFGCRCPGVGLREFTFDGVFGPKVIRYAYSGFRVLFFLTPALACRSRRKTCMPTPPMHPLQRF